MITKNKKRVIAAIAAILVLMMSASTFSFFSDKVTITGQTKTGVLALKCDKSDIDLKNIVFNVDNFGPGDTNIIEYTLSAAGNKAMRVDDYATVTIVLDNEYAKDAVFDSVLQSKITLNQDGGLTLNVDKSSYNSDTKTFTLVYDSPQAIVSGVGENAEIVPGHTETSVPRNYTLTFNNVSNDAWQNCKTKVVISAGAVQYAHT